MAYASVISPFNDVCTSAMSNRGQRTSGTCSTLALLIPTRLSQALLRQQKMRSALALIICDLLAACQALGFTGPQSTNFCSYCQLQLKDINNLNAGDWEPCSCEEHRRLVFEWWDALLEAQCAEITSKHGVHYSEFL